MGMDTFLAIASRREVRTYDGRPIPDDATRRILDAGRLAGSSQNRQQRRFIVVRSRVDDVARAVWAPRNVSGAALVVAIVTYGRGPLAFDAGRAAQNMMLAAWNEGIGSCPNGSPDRDAVGSMLGLHAGEEPVIILTFGYPTRPVDLESRPPEEWIRRANRKDFDEVVETV
jgi:nitroreductase